MKEMIEFAQYLNAKFCHELAGTLGAINNGVEFLAESDLNIKEKATELIRISAKQAIAKLMFYRQAYGVIKVQGEADLKEFRKLTENFLDDSKVTFEFNEKYMYVPGVFIDNNTCKLLYCLIVNSFDNLLQGGTIKFRCEKANEGKKLILSLAGASIKNDEEKRTILQGDYSKIAISTMNIHSFYTRKLAESVNTKIKIESDNTTLEYIIEQGL